ncbi:MAG: hypothetical protein LBG92_05760 [Prevotellaceae bacterium]|jgi:hypothetical protein|nr:hypothetical protein [Prevotellaceae bacterium]
MSNEIELRKSENKFIIGKVPSWIARWGNLVILAVCLFLLYLSFNFTFPVVIQGKIHVSNDNVYIIIPRIKQNMIKSGQSAGLRMDDYPYMDYGIFQGKVAPLENIISEKNSIYVPIDVFDEKNAVNRSDLIQNMTGTGDIVIDRIPVIYRILKTK